MGHLAPFVLLGKTPDGTCPECGRVHESDQPHDQQSLAYQYSFFDKNGRWPTWKDALEHCPQPIKDYWVEELSKKGISVE